VYVVVVLAAIALNEVDDVRPVLEFYSQFDDPIAAFRDKQRQLQVIICSDSLLYFYHPMYSSSGL